MNRIVLHTSTEVTSTEVLVIVHTYVRIRKLVTQSSDNNGV